MSKNEKCRRDGRNGGIYEAGYKRKESAVCIWMPGLQQYGHKAEVAGFIDRGSGSETVAAGTCPENGNGRLQRLAFLLLSSSPHGDGRVFQGKEIYEGCGVKHKS